MTYIMPVIIRSDLKWSTNTDYICTKGFSRLWMLRRLKVLGAEKQELLDVYRQQVISVLELAVPVWAPGLTKNEAKQIERVQKVALHIILGTDYISYSQALGTVNLKRLSTRREDICLKFAKKSIKNPKFSQWFSLSENLPQGIQTRSKKTLLKPVITRTNKYAKSTLPYITDLLNKCTWTENENIFM